MEEVKEAFKFFDSVGDSKIAVSEIGKCLRALGYSPTEDQVLNLTKSWQNKETRITIEEFTPILNDVESLKRAEKQFSTSDYIEAFTQLDRNRDGWIMSAELKFMLMHMGERLSQMEVEKTLFGFENTEGKINIKNYVERMCGSNAQF